MEQTVRPYAIAGAALLGASMIAVTPVVKLPSLPEIQTSAVQLTAEADAFAVLVNVLDPGAFTNGITAAPTDALGTLAVSGDSFIDSLGTPYITAADNLATDLLPLLDITSLFSGLSTTLGNLPDLTTLLSELGNLPTATDIANAVISALTGADGALTTITGDLGTISTDLTGLPSTLTTDLINALTGAGGSLTTITGDLGTITTDLGGISTQLGTVTTDLGTLGTGLNEILTHLGLTTILGL